VCEAKACALLATDKEWLMSQAPVPSVTLFGKRFSLPRSRTLRLGVGVGLCLGGVLGFLPILGFWMLPLGVLVLSNEFHFLRRRRRQMALKRARKRQSVQTRAGRSR
jgi:purine-cytosine permease-like protein